MNGNTLFLVIRHGETDWNRQNRMMGSSDIPLNAEGLLQARKTAKYMASLPLDHIVSSPLTRAMQTAEAIRTYHMHIPITTLYHIRERTFGELEGLVYEEANARCPQLTMGSMWQYPDFRPPGGESIADVRKRAERALIHLLASYRGKTVAVVTHGAFIRNFLSVMLDLPLPEINSYGFGNASISVASYTPHHGGYAHILNRKP